MGFFCFWFNFVKIIVFCLLLCIKCFCRISKMNFNEIFVGELIIRVFNNFRNSRLS